MPNTLISKRFALSFITQSATIRQLSPLERDLALDYLGRRITSYNLPLCLRESKSFILIDLRHILGSSKLRKPLCVGLQELKVGVARTPPH